MSGRTGARALAAPLLLAFLAAFVEAQAQQSVLPVRSEGGATAVAVVPPRPASSFYPSSGDLHRFRSARAAASATDGSYRGMLTAGSAMGAYRSKMYRAVTSVGAAEGGDPFGPEPPGGEPRYLLQARSLARSLDVRRSADGCAATQWAPKADPFRFTSPFGNVNKWVPWDARPRDCA
jgi:hypothetical protein